LGIGERVDESENLVGLLLAVDEEVDEGVAPLAEEGEYVFR
jgi:hypothetical protein